MNASYPRFLKYTIANITGMLGISCYILADTFFIANGIGPNGLAALNLAIPIYSFVHGCGLMLGTGGATKYLIAKCQYEHKRANTMFTNSIKIGFLFSIVFLCIGLCFSQQLTLLLNADAELFDMTNIYIKVILLFSPFFITNEQLLAYVRNDGAPTLSMIAMVSGSIANIILDYIFIYPMQMGIFGAVLATGIAPIVSILILSYHLLGKACGFHMNMAPITKEIANDTLILGFPTLVTEVSAGLIMILFNILIMNRAGNMGVAAYGIIANIALVTTAIFTGFTQGVQPLISEAHSIESHSALKNYTHWTIGGGSALSIILYACMYFFANPITALFNSSCDAVLQNLGETGLKLYFTALPFTAMNMIIAGSFTATEKPLPAHVITLLRGMILIFPLSLIMAQQYGLNGIWLTVTATEALTLVIASYLWNKYSITQKSSL